MGESRIKNTSRNIIYAFAFQIVKIALVFISRIIFVKQLGASYLGVNGLFTNILGVLSIADLGITTALMYSLYKPLAEKDEDKVAQYINYFKWLYNLIATVIAIVGVSLIPLLKYLVNLPEEMPNIYLYYILLLINTVLSYLFIYKTTVLSADQKMYIINKYDTIFQFILFVLQIIVLIITKSFALYLTANILCTFLSNLMKVRETEKTYPYLKDKKRAKLPKTERKKVFENLYSLFFYKLGGIIQSNTDNILISIFVGTIYVGYYSNYSTIILSITTFITLVFTALKASVGNYVVSKNEKEQFKLFNILEVYNYCLVGFCSICFMILIPDFVLICFGEEYVLGVDVLICMVLNFYTSNIRQTIWIYRETSGAFKETKYTTIVTSIINIILSIVFGFYWGMTGIILATVVARMMYAWWKEPLIIYEKYFKESVKTYYFANIRRFMLLVAMLFGIYLVCELVRFSNIYVNLIFKALICLMISVLVFCTVYIKNPALLILKQKVFKKNENIKEK